MPIHASTRNLTEIQSTGHYFQSSFTYPRTILLILFVLNHTGEVLGPQPALGPTFKPTRLASRRARLASPTCKPDLHSVRPASPTWTRSDLQARPALGPTCMPDLNSVRPASPIWTRPNLSHYYGWLNLTYLWPGKVWTEPISWTLIINVVYTICGLQACAIHFMDVQIHSKILAK